MGSETHPSYPKICSEKFEQKNPESALQVHYQELHGNNCLAGFFQAYHNTAKAI